MTELIPRTIDTSAAAAIGLTAEKIAIIKNSLAKELTSTEFELLLSSAATYGLDPIKRQIYAIKIKGRLSIVTGIDGYRLIAARTGQLDGIDAPEYYDGKAGKWVDIWTRKGELPEACRVNVWRKGASKPFAGVAIMDEVNRKDGQWAARPLHMAAIRAEAYALRKAFPSDLAGLYEETELRDEEGAGEPIVIDADAPAPVGMIDAKTAPSPTFINQDQQNRLVKAVKAKATGSDFGWLQTILREVAGVDRRDLITVDKYDAVMAAVESARVTPDPLMVEADEMLEGAVIEVDEAARNLMDVDQR